MPTLLIADNDRVTALLVQAFVRVEFATTQVRFAHTTDDAREALVRAQPTAVLVELALDRGTGETLVADALEQCSTIYVAAMSDSKPAGAVTRHPEYWLGHFPKPIELSALIDALVASPEFATDRGSSCRSSTPEQAALSAVREHVKGLVAALAGTHRALALAGVSELALHEVVERSVPSLLSLTYELWDSWHRNRLVGAEISEHCSSGDLLYDIRRRVGALLATLHALAVEAGAPWWSADRLRGVCDDYALRLAQIAGDLAALVRPTSAG